MLKMMVWSLTVVLGNEVMKEQGRYRHKAYGAEQVANNDKGALRNHFRGAQRLAVAAGRGLVASSAHYFNTPILLHRLFAVNL
jgi:hypothetical protein